MVTQNVMGRSRSAWSIAEVAERNWLSKQFVRNEIAAGRLKAKRLGRRVVIPVASEREWLEAAPQK
jgi:excisionase family DNA binding protein